jgi:hypothetical protein
MQKAQIINRIHNEKDTGCANSNGKVNQESHDKGC